MSAPIAEHPIDRWEGEERYYHEDLDLGYIAGAGFDLARALSRGTAAEIAYQPGDGTFYGLVFVPLAYVETAAPRVVNGASWDRHACRGVLSPDAHGAYFYAPNAFLIAWLDHATYPVRLGNRGRELAVSYVAEHWQTSIVSAGSLALLFRAVSWYLDRKHLLIGRRPA